MADVINISEANTASETVTDGISNGNYGSTDAANLTTSTYPIRAGENSYDKYHKLHWATKDVYTQLSNITVYRSAGTLSGSDTHTYEEDATFATPSTADITGTAFPTTSTEAFSVTGTLTAQGEYSSYVRSQIQVDSATTAGASGLTITWTYDAQA